MGMVRMVKERGTIKRMDDRFGPVAVGLGILITVIPSYQIISIQLI